MSFTCTSMSCPQCREMAEKYYYFHTNYYFRCNNPKCPVLDIENPQDKKPGWVEPEVVEPKFESKPVVPDDDFIYWDDVQKDIDDDRS